jgi:glycerol uptake facilitator-like aquaporin
MTAEPLLRRMLAEYVGSAVLVAVVVGSGISAQLRSDDAGVQLLVNSLATVGALGVLISVLGPISGAHLNPLVSGVEWLFAIRRPGITAGRSGTQLAGYVVAQILGAVSGAVLANAMWAEPAGWSGTQRSGTHLWLSEGVATAGLLLVVLVLARTGRSRSTAWAVAAYIGAAYWFTASTSFANPAVTIGRMFTDTFAGIAPASVPAMLAAQLLGAAVGVGLTVTLAGDRTRRTGPAVAAEAHR